MTKVNVHRLLLNLLPYSAKKIVHEIYVCVNYINEAKERSAETKKHKDLVAEVLSKYTTSFVDKVVDNYTEMLEEL